ncbi:MAG: hypothetical protein AAFP16_02105 [Pseudomonadota bacterium]
MAIATCCVLSACGDPLRGIERVSEVPDALPEDDRAAIATPDDTTDDTPILAGLFRRTRPNADPAVDAAVTEALGDEATGIVEPQADAPAADDPGETVQTASIESGDAAPAPGRTGVFGWLRQATEAQVQTAAPLDGAAQSDTTTRAAADMPVADPEQVATRAEPEAGQTPVRRSLFGPRAARTGTWTRNGPDARDVPVGTVLPFGQIARVCDAKPRDMGKIVERAARKGKGYELYDSVPDSAQPRTFYITGFADNCPRQFTAALALFGTPEAHEQLRYGLPARNYPYSTTDEAYETIKSRVCNVSRKKPCGPRISRFDKTTIFVSAYEHFGENARWADMLLHEGEVLAAALKAP